MTCDLCGKNEATVHLTEIINDQTRELHLCEPCAQEKGAAAAEQFGLAGLLAGLTEAGLKPGLRAGEGPKCPRCEMTYEDFRKSGRLGCGGCYETFRKYLAPLLKRIHGSTEYAGALAPPAAGRAAAAGRAGAVGKTIGRAEPAAKAGRGPGPADLLARLKEQLREAVAAERFEEAARLRDKIRALEPRKGPAPSPKRGQVSSAKKGPGSSKPGRSQ